MLSFFKEYKGFAIVFGVLSIIIVSIIYNTLNVYKPLHIYQPAMVSTELVDSTIQHQKKYHKIADFSLVNQNGKTITQNDYKDKIYVADFFFTTCQTICPIMTNHMVKIQKEFLKDSTVMLLSLSVTPELDNPEVLRAYANDKGVIDAKWNVTTGDKKHIYELARKSYFTVVEQGDGNLQDFIHTPNFVLIDKKKRIRGIYNGTLDDEIKRLIDDINLLTK